MPLIVRKRCEKGLLWLIALEVTNLGLFAFGPAKGSKPCGEHTGVPGALFTVPK